MEFSGRSAARPVRAQPRLRGQITERVLAELADEIPPAWDDDDYDVLMRLLEQIYRRRARVPELLLLAKNSNRQPFPHWQGDS